MRKRVMGLIVVLSLILAGGSIFAVFSQGKEAEMPNIPGITVEDTRPNGCVDCHRKDGSERSPLKLLIKEWTKGVSSELLEKARAAAPAGVELKGKHADTVAMTNTVPQDCLVCHSKQGAKMIGAPELGRLMHLTHLVGGAENEFITGYQGQCVQCHALNKETGELTIKNGEA
jgi:cytochrome c553